MPPKGGGGGGGAQPAWKKPAGSGPLSGKAKKEYLKWKRDQKRQAGDSDSDDDWDVETTAPQAAGTQVATGGATQHAPDSKAPTTHRAGGTGTQPADAQPQQQQDLGSAAPDGAGAARKAFKRDDVPIQYADLVVLPPDDSNVASDGAEQVEMRLPRCRAAEVGFTEAGLKLGMPKRPAWKGVVRNAAELHAMEEKALSTWCNTINTSYEPGRVSFYETRLDFWQQLWRVLDLCDVALMIVDARNPLLHFSEALASHVLHEHRKPLVLVLNKSDLVPAASVKAWSQWFSSRHPGITVVTSSAANEHSATSSKGIMQAILDCNITRHSNKLKVSDIVTKSAEAILVESRQRNTVAKRGTGAAPQAPVSAAGSSGDEHEDDEDDEADEWTTKGTKARKMGAIRKKRAGRKGTHTAQSQPQAGTGKAGGRKASKGRQAASSDGGGSEAGGDTAGERFSDDEEEEEEQEEEGENYNADLEQFEQDLLNNQHDQEDEDEEVTIISTGGGQGGDSKQAAGKPGMPGAGTGTGKKKMPVVVCVVGEPNVGKSSTMNCLLGTHKVAVSSHPGRTKHYQTHYMTDNLMLCDCPGLVFPRLDVPLAMQVLYGSYPIARCRDPYAVIRYLAAHAWPRVHMALGLRKVDEAGNLAVASEGSSSQPDDVYTPTELCEAYAARKSWRSRKGGRLDVYRAANWILRAGLAGKYGVSLAFLPPAPEEHLPEVHL